MTPRRDGPKEVHVDCAQFREIVHDMDREGTQGYELRASALDHAETCGACSTLLTDVEALDFALSRQAIEDAGEHAPARVEAALLNEFRKQQGEQASPRRSFRMAAMGIAAGFVLVLGLSVRHWIMPTPNAPGGNTPAVESAQNGVASDADESASTDDDSTTGTDFVALPYAADPATMEDATIVRVTLSRSALASFGVPVADLSGAEAIPADIALSEDGSPQAIRLVSAETAEQSY